MQGVYMPWYIKPELALFFVYHLTHILPARPQNLTSSRLVITFSTRADNLPTNLDLYNATLVKRYGRRLVLDLRRPFDLEEEALEVRRAMLAVERVEMDYLVNADSDEIAADRLRGRGFA